MLASINPPQYQVVCIEKSDLYSRITAVGVKSGNGAYARITEDDAIRAIDSGQYRLYVMVAGYLVYVETEIHNGRKYLKTKPDGTGVDNLLRLDKCVWR